MTMRITETALRRAIRVEALRILQEDIRVGDLRAQLRAAKGKKLRDAGVHTAKKMGVLGLKGALSLIPGASFVGDAIEAGAEIKDLIDVAKSLKPKEKESSPLWDFLTIDPDVSDILDNGVEDKFLLDLGKDVESLPDDAILPDADVQLNSWLKSNYGGTQVLKQK